MKAEEVSKKTGLPESEIQPKGPRGLATSTPLYGWAVRGLLGAVSLCESFRQLGAAWDAGWVEALRAAEARLADLIDAVDPEAKKK